MSYLLTLLKQFGFIDEQDSQPELKATIESEVGSAYHKIKNNFTPFSLTQGYITNIRSGTLTIHLTPSNIQIQGAQWRRAGTLKWFNSGETEYFVPVGAYVIEYQNITDYTPPTDDELVIVNAREQVIEEKVFTYIAPKSSFIVNIIPAQAVEEGARWRIKGTTTWRESGYEETNLLLGNYEIEFLTLDWTNKPADAIVAVTRGVVNTYTYEYEIIPKTGSLKVIISPSDAILAGAKWRREGTIPWLDSNYTESNISIGDYVVEFLTIDAWYPPIDVPVTITGNTLTEASQTYELIPTKGSLRVHLQPNEIHETLGGKWRRQGTIPWFLHGETETDIDQGTYDLEFTVIEEWDSPPATSVNIIPLFLTSLTVDYVYHPIYGDFQVFIEPSGAVSAGAQWRVVGETTWRNSGDVILKQLAGFYDVEFKDVLEWTKSANQTYQIEPAKLNTKIATYIWTPTVGSLKVTLGPMTAVDAGAKWRRVGTTDWFDSGYEEMNIPGGTYEVEVQNPDLARFVSPSNLSVTVTNGYKTESELSFSVIGEPANIYDYFIHFKTVIVQAVKRIPPTHVTVTLTNATGLYPVSVVSAAYLENVTITLNLQASFIINNSTENFFVSCDNSNSSFTYPSLSLPTLDANSTAYFTYVARFDKTLEKSEVPKFAIISAAKKNVYQILTIQPDSGSFTKFAIQAAAKDIVILTKVANPDTANLNTFTIVSAAKKNVILTP